MSVSYHTQVMTEDPENAYIEASGYVVDVDTFRIPFNTTPDGIVELGVTSVETVELNPDTLSSLAKLSQRVARANLYLASRKPNA